MRSRLCSIGVRALVLSATTALVAACSSGGSQQGFTTSNLSQRPEQGMAREAPRHYPDGSTSGGSYADGTYGRPYAEAPRKYVDPGHPTPREFAAAHPTPDHRGYAAPSRIQTASIGNAPHTPPYDARGYNPDARWQQRPPSQWSQQQAPVTTGSTAPGPYSPHSPQIIQVREGDTLFALSRRYNVPVADLVAANRLPNERIAIGQRLVIPTRYR